MKKLAYLLACGVACFSVSTTLHALEAPTGDPTIAPVRLRTTCYCDTGITASGAETRPGIVAGCPEWLGCVAAIYEVAEDGTMGDFIGYYEVLDTGAGIDTDGDGIGDSLKKGWSIDVYQPTQEGVTQWQQDIGDYAYVKIIRGQG